MAEITGGELLLRCVQREGIEFVIGITDEGYHTIQHHCADYGFRHVAPRHEAAAAHIAQGIFKTSGAMSLVLAGGGPGTANVLSGVICALAEGVPMLVVTAQRRAEVVYPSKPGIFQAMDQQEMFRPVTKWNAVVHQWERIPEIVSRAFREALAGRPGPVHIDMTDTIMNATGDDGSVEVLDPAQYRSTVPAEPTLSETAHLVDLIRDAKCPVLMAGVGVLNSEGWGEFRELVELLDCPALTSGHGHTALPDDHPNHLRPGSEGHWAARREADLVIAFGTCLGEVDLPFDKYWGGADQKLVQVDIDPRNIGLHRRLHRGVVADAGAALRRLLAAVKEAGIAASDGSEAARFRAMSDSAAQAMMGDIEASFAADRVHPAQVILAMQSVFPTDAINVADGGNTGMFNRALRDFSTPRTQVGNYEFGHLGTGIPHAIGAKLANPERDVVCSTGDGAAGFNIMELETAVRDRVKITVVVNAEGSWSMEEMLHLEADVPEDRYRSTYMSPTRWDVIAEGMGCHGEYVEQADQLVPALERARQHEGAALVCVKTDREMNLHPPGTEVFGEVYTGSED